MKLHLLTISICLSLVTGSKLSNPDSIGNILVLVPFTGPSHWIYIRQFVLELLNRGHNVTAITNYKLNENVTRYEEILIDPPFDIFGIMPADQLYQQTLSDDWSAISMYWDLGLTTSPHGLKSKNVKNFINSLINRTDHFDLVFAEQFFQESWLMFAHIIGAPIITIGTYGYSDFMDRAMGLMTPWSHVPHMVLNYGDAMTFSERCYNVILSLYDMFMREYYYLPQQNRFAKEAFGVFEKNGPLPTVQELEKSISLMLINANRAVTDPRPSMPGLINIAGAHIRSPKPLPDDIQKLLDNSKEGVIYFSMGSFMQSADMPKEKAKIFLDAFGKLNQSVIWKWEDDSLTNIPSNVMIRKWLPQSDILAHKNVILFITHGGMFGTMEGLYQGVPMLFLPLFGDQMRNALKTEAKGYGRTLQFSKVTSELLTEYILEIVNNPQYHAAAKKYSTIFRDNPIHPMDEAMFWIEYVIRHRGAPHLKSSAVNLPIYAYLLWDVFGLFILILIGCIYGTYWLVKKINGLKRVETIRSDKKKK